MSDLLCLKNSKMDVDLILYDGEDTAKTNIPEVFTPYLNDI